MIKSVPLDEVTYFRRSVRKTERNSKQRDSSSRARKTREVWVGFITRPDPSLARFLIFCTYSAVHRALFHIVNAWNRPHMRLKGKPQLNTTIDNNLSLKDAKKLLTRLNSRTGASSALARVFAKKVEYFPGSR